MRVSATSGPGPSLGRLRSKDSRCVRLHGGDTQVRQAGVQSFGLGVWKVFPTSAFPEWYGGLQFPMLGSEVLGLQI